MIIERQAIRALLITPEAEILLMRIRNPAGGEHFWIAPGGGIEPGESAEDAMRRELAEELGLTGVELGPLVWRRQHEFSWSSRRLRQTEQYHVVHVARFEPRRGDTPEFEFVDRFRWWPVAELARTQERLTPLALARIVESYLADGPPQGPLELEVLVD